MNSLLRVIVFVFVGALLSACVYNKAVPIGGGAWVMETDGYGPLGSSIATTQTLQNAANLTLQQGYTHFLLGPAPDGPNDIGARALLYGSATVVAFGSPVAGASSDRPDVRTTVLVTMMRRGDPRVPKAYDALQVMADAI